jgi:hypothetical protein
LETEYDPWKEEIERIDRQILEDLRAESDYQLKIAKKKMEDYNIPQPPEPLSSEWMLIKYVNDYIAANFVVH